MKRLILICGPNGVGKTTLCKALNKKLMNSALVEPEWGRMINPFYFDDEKENINRMIKDERDADRIKRALSIRSIYEGLNYPIINTTNLSVEQTVEKVIEKVNNSQY